MVARKPAIKRGSVPPGALCCNVRALRCHVRALRCHVRPSGRLPDRLHDPRLAKDVKSCLPIARTSRTWSSRMTFASPKSLCYNEFCRPNDLDDERGLLRLQGNFRGGVCSHNSLSDADGVFGPTRLQRHLLAVGEREGWLRHLPFRLLPGLDMGGRTAAARPTRHACEGAGVMDTEPHPNGRGWPHRGNEVA
jgi:hypothetical protein